ncbi:MAG: hypothetical protein HY785_05255 [Oscillatoriophycideae cyanobacterium NC_groundwater_1537_Pr4_S-0.65um_50_18]|nr:hypothetical protein [Oscillatoriophycideae cyanobacterium NC_groundwater_1537_Pr4_S-0.65um_50_18]
MQSGVSTFNPVTSIQNNSTQHTNIALIDVFSVMMAIAFPAVVIVAIGSYRKHRARVLRRQIQHLNRVWQLSSSQKMS